MLDDREYTELVFDLLADADVMQEFEDDVWLKVDKGMWEMFCKESNLDRKMKEKK